jgi:hypothetical protein
MIVTATRFMGVTEMDEADDKQEEEGESQPAPPRIRDSHGLNKNIAYPWPAVPSFRWPDVS